MRPKKVKILRQSKVPKWFKYFTGVTVQTMPIEAKKGWKMDNYEISGSNTQSSRTPHDFSISVHHGN